jgi:hypothetical protein
MSSLSPFSLTGCFVPLSGHRRSEIAAERTNARTAGRNCNILARRWMVALGRHVGQIEIVRQHRGNGQQNRLLIFKQLVARRAVEPIFY